MLSQTGFEELDTAGLDVYQAIADQVNAFRANYATWSSEGKSDLVRLAVDLDTAESQLVKAQRAAYDVGDLEGVRAYGVSLSQLRDARALHGDVSSKAASWGSTWDTLAAWLASAGNVMGLGFPLIPLGITAAVAVAAIAALAWVMNTWQDLRARTATLKDLADRLAAGTLTTEQVKTLTPSLSAGGGLFSMGTLGTVGLLVVGLLVFQAVRK